MHSAPQRSHDQDHRGFCAIRNLLFDALIVDLVVVVLVGFILPFSNLNFFFIVYCMFDKCIKIIFMLLWKHLKQHSEETLSLYVGEFITRLFVSSLNAFIANALVCVDSGLLEFASD